MKKRMIVVLVIFFAVALGITGKLGYEQLFNASKLESGALNARLREIDIKANRGTIWLRRHIFFCGIWEFISYTIIFH